MKPRALQSSAVRICHMADVHLGYRKYARVAKNGFNQREVDVSTAFREAVDRIIALKPHAVLISGDLFHSVRPSNAVLTFAYRELRRLIKGTGAPCIIIAGNHEFPKRADTGSPLRLLAELEGCFVADSESQRFTFAEHNLAVMAVPHGALAGPAELLVRADERFAVNVLMLHGQLETGWMSDFGGHPIEIERLSPHEWDYIALGHVHVHRAVGLNGAYPGALEHTAVNFWAEAREPKGFLEITLSKGTATRTFHALTSPRAVAVIEPIDCFGCEAPEVDSRIAEKLGAVSGGIGGKLVRLELQGLSRATFRQLDHRALRLFRGQALNLTIDVHPPVAGVNRSAPAALRRGVGFGAELSTFVEQSAHEHRGEIAPLLATYLHRMEKDDEARSA